MLQTRDGATAGFLSLRDLPPGVWRNGTEYQARGRWRDASLVRFFGGTIRPWLGWTPHSASAAGAAARALLAWQDPANLAWIAAATPTAVFVYSRSGGRSDITPAGLAAGRADAVLTAGYGGGAFGGSTFGDVHGGCSSLQEATVWTLDTLEGLLVGCNADDGRLWSWDGDTAHAMTRPTGSPANNVATFVTNEGFVFVLGAGGDPRKVQWADQSSLTDWTPSDLNQARSYSIATPGRLMCGVRASNANLVFTSTDVHLATYAGLPDIYEFACVGAGCGVISRAAVARAEGFVAWMGPSGWWTYDGQTAPVASTIQDDVFSSLNPLQRSKIWALHNPAYGEITWFYPRGSEIDAYASWNYRENHWTNGQLTRLAGCEAGVFPWPVMVDAGGQVLQHENGLAYAGAGAPYLESGPLELGDGDQVFDLAGLEPDASTLGDVTLTVASRFHPLGPQTLSGPYALAAPTPLRIAGREHRLRFTAASASDWRLGAGTRLDVRSGGLR
ncbi:MAG TPA: hypothetical protein VG939_11180 [Caulobacteraceae bacterium]|nr:hypothetical protein [Caulobacteraceae bacterium]